MDLERGCTMSCAATHDERVRVRAAAAAAGLTVSELIRHAALGMRVPTVLVPPEFLRHAMQLAQLADDLRGLASNNNQLSKTANTSALVGGGVDPETARAISGQLPVLGAQLDALREQLDALRETLVRPRFR